MVIRSKLILDTDCRGRPLGRQPEKKIVDPPHVMRPTTILTNEALRPGTRLKVSVLVDATLDGVEVATKHGPNRWSIMFERR